MQLQEMTLPNKITITRKLTDDNCTQTARKVEDNLSPILASITMGVNTINILQEKVDELLSEMKSVREAIKGAFENNGLVEVNFGSADDKKTIKYVDGGCYLKLDAKLVEKHFCKHPEYFNCFTPVNRDSQIRILKRRINANLYKPTHERFAVGKNKER